MKKPRPVGLILFLACFAVLAPEVVTAQETPQRLIASMLDCAMHEDGGPWVPKDLRADGLLRFNYLHETRKLRPKRYDYDDERPYIYVAFWNSSKTKAEFLDFGIEAGPRRWLTISNDGQIYFLKGKLNFDFFQGGEWMRDHYMIRVRKLYAAPVRTIQVRDTKHTGVLCDSLTHPHPEWDPKWRGPNWP